VAFCVDPEKLCLFKFLAFKQFLHTVHHCIPVLRGMIGFCLIGYFWPMAVHLF